MTLAQVLQEVWKGALADALAEVEVDGRRYRVERTRSKGLVTVSFPYAGQTIDGIEQNPETKSRWAQMARDGKRIMQFTTKHRYFANVAEGVLTRYPAWAALGLPE